MKRCTIQADELAELDAITQKGSHRSQKVINALVLLNCGKGKFNEGYKTGAEIAGVLRRVDRVKKRHLLGRITANLLLSLLALAPTLITR